MSGTTDDVRTEDYEKMIDLSRYQVWFVTGSQGLYGPETLEQVAKDSKEIATFLDRDDRVPTRVIHKPTLTTSDAILKLCLEANADYRCVGLVMWMHTFSPAKMWIAGLKVLNKPFVHLHTQYGREIPWSEIDMDFMNLHQSAHGGREFGFIGSRLRLERKVIVGYWQDAEVLDALSVWVRAACGFNEMNAMQVARFGDNMRQVAVTEGDKVSAQITFGYEVHGYGVGDLVACMDEIEESRFDRLVEEYRDTYVLADEVKNTDEGEQALIVAARIEAALREFLEEGGFRAFTTTFEELHGLSQLPGIAVQRLMGDGYGFGAEGDWKTAALVRSMKVMSAGLPGGTSFMEDYTYNLTRERAAVLGAHMLEICESTASGTPRLEIHPLSIGGKSDPVRLVFNVPPGPAVNATIIDMGNRFRMIVNEVDVIDPPQDLPNLPVARAFWVPRPSLSASAASWILAGGAHHMSFSQSVTTECLEDFAEMAGIECAVIDAAASPRSLKKELRWNEAYYALAGGFRS